MCNNNPVKVVIFSQEGNFMNKNGFSRRNFLKGGMLTLAGVMGAGLTAGCGHGREHMADEKRGGPPSSSGGVASEPDFLKPPAPITDISSTVDTEIVVVGAGMSGLCAAISAMQEGAKVVVIEKTQSVNFRSYDYGAINAKVQRDNGTAIDVDQVTTEFMRYGSYRNDQRVVEVFTRQSGMVNDWLLDLAQKAGCTVKHIWTKDELVAPASTLPTFPSLTFVLDPPAGAAEKMPKGLYGGDPTVAMGYTLLSTAENLGADIRYKTPAVQLVRKDNQGRVTGVIAKDESGKYIQFNASKAVIMCAGDYGHDPEMLAYYIPTSSSISKISYPGTDNTGDGQKMGVWIGAAIDEWPHTAMYFDKAFVDNPRENPDALVRQPWLAVNAKGERFSNEDLTFGYISNQVRQQPGQFRWTIWDAKWPTEAPSFKQTACKEMMYHHNPADIERYIQDGLVKQANTIEELAQVTELPADTLKKTIERYNELARKKVDEDFYKKPLFMTTIEQAPFYAAKLGTSMLVTLGGLQINDKMQVLDKDKNVIPGLYAAGNNSGCFFGNDYPTAIPGNSHGRAQTFGYFAGKNAAAETV